MRAESVAVAGARHGAMADRAAAAPRAAWWERRSFAVLLVFLATLPLLWPAIPPLTDVMGHMGRFRIALAGPQSPLHQWYSFDWRPVGNLGVDLLVMPLAPLIGLEHATKLVVLGIPALTVAGMLAVAREVHGRLPATTVFAVPFASSWPLQFGFVNFALAMALALLGFALWLRMDRTGTRPMRGWIFALLAPALWIAHAFGWATLVMLAGAAELAHARAGGRGWIAAGLAGALAVLPLGTPVLLMVLTRQSGAPPAVLDWEWWPKVGYFLSSLRDHHAGLDLFELLVTVALIGAGISGRGFRMASPLGLAALVLGLAFLLLPYEMMNGSYVDMRVAPYALAMGVLALAPARLDRDKLELIAVAGLALLAARTAVATVSLARHDAAFRTQLAALDHLPRGARVFALVNLDCYARWDPSRMNSLGAMAIVRREAFVNGQWALPGVHLLRVHFPAPDRFTRDASQVIRPGGCRVIDVSHYPQVLGELPRDRFDYLWLIDFPPAELPDLPWLDQVWHGPTGGLYRIRHAARRLPGARHPA